MFFGKGVELVKTILAHTATEVTKLVKPLERQNAQSKSILRCLNGVCSSQAFHFKIFVRKLHENFSMQILKHKFL
jgi:hypothetical protein